MDCRLALLLEISRLKEKDTYEHRAAYNIFQVLQVSSREVVMCRFLADLLNPQAQHGYGILFLKTFLTEVLLLQEGCMSDTMLFHTQVCTEYEIDEERRIDIVIKNTAYFIPIEVKIFAGEQQGQCFAYDKYAKNSPMIYLTRFGDMPSEYSRRSKEGTKLLSMERIRCISWKYHIVPWLSRLSVSLKEPMWLTVAQYIYAIQGFTRERDMKNMDENLEILYRSPDYFEAGLSIERSMKTAKVKVMRLLFEDFCKEFEQTAEKYGLELETQEKYYTYEEQCNPKFYEISGTTYPGVNYLCKKAQFQKDGLQLWFRAEIDYLFFAGFTLFDKYAEGGSGWQVLQITEEMLDEVKQYLEEDILSPDDWWLTWCYSNGKCQEGDYEDVPDFKHMNACAISLVDEQKRKAFVKKAISVFEAQLLQYLKL